MRPTIDQVNYLNIGLMVVACVVSYVYPFELFLFSYAFLGPLHYLTEISWLHDRNYFVEARRAREAKSRRAWLALVIVTLVVMFYGLIAERVLQRNVSPVWEIALFYLVFVTAALLWPMRKKSTGIVVIASTLIALGFFSASRYYFLTAYLLITVIHVLVFTAAFILYGALKTRNLSGVLSLAVFFICGASFFVYAPTGLGHTAGEYVRSSYGSFQTLNAELIKISHLGAGTSLKEIYESTAGLIVMRLIAFAYTYHYLNWFSKTSIIKWHEIPKSRTAIIICVWMSALVLYGCSYQTGMVALYFLSVLHVMLEFPLNHQTFAGIGRELYALAHNPSG
jgi:4-amino-4-deoxy-L-arabinose transferase-like glycosyltransferase